VSSIHRVIEKASVPARTLREASAVPTSLSARTCGPSHPLLSNRAITDARWSPPAPKRYPGEVVEEVVTEYRD